MFEEICPDDETIMAEIGKLRYDVWMSEGSIDTAQFPNGIWLDADADPIARHFIARTASDGRIIGAARLVTHVNEVNADRDVALWTRTGHSLVWPVSDLGRLVVHRDFRGRFH